MRPSVTYEGTSSDTGRYIALTYCSVIFTKKFSGLYSDFMVDPVTEKAIGRTIQVPSGAMISEKGNQTIIEYNGEILFTFDPMEEKT